MAKRSRQRRRRKKQRKRLRKLVTSAGTGVMLLGSFAEGLEVIKHAAEFTLQVLG